MIFPLVTASNNYSLPRTIDPFQTIRFDAFKGETIVWPPNLGRIPLGGMAGTTTTAATTTERKRMTTICLSKYFDGSCEATIAANSLQLLPLLPCLPVLLTTKLAYCSLRSSFTVEKPWKAFFCLLCYVFHIFSFLVSTFYNFDFKVKPLKSFHLNLN